MKRLFLFIVIIAANGSIALADSGRLYGTVVTTEGKEITGAIRWDDEEVFWSDHFNGRKSEPFDLSALDSDDRETIYDRQPGPQINFGDTTVEFIKLFGSDGLEPQHFAIEFGSIAEVIPGRGEYVTLKLRDGSEIEADGGSNDMRADIQVRSDDGTSLEFDWDDVERVRFSEPSDKPSPFEQHLYGTVHTKVGDFTGVMQWDQDERFWSERLDGEVDGNEVSIEFTVIRSIVRDGDEGSLVENRDGTTQRVTGTNDVDDSNRGLYIDQVGVGRVDIPWDVFISATFPDAEPDNLPGYGDYASIAELKGWVESTDGKRLEGNLAYDVDETTSAELISGWDENGIRYYIPIRNIRSVRPLGDTSEITLRDGGKLTLGRDRDVNSKNNGVVIRQGDDSQYLAWPDVASVHFD